MESAGWSPGQRRPRPCYHLATDEDSLERLRPNLRALLAERGAKG